MPCVFCTNLHAAGELILDDEFAWVLLHPDWSPRGHLMIVAKRHVENASALDEEEWLHVARLWHRVESVLLDLTNAGRAIVMKLGIQTPHLHIHLYPMPENATRDDVFAAIDGKAQDPHDPEFVRRLTAALD